MAKQNKRLPEKYQRWIDARKRFYLSHAQIQMARELGMNPNKFGKLANHKQERWKAPLRVFIQDCYYKRFGKMKPDIVKPIEQTFKDYQKKKEEHKKRKQERKLDAQNEVESTSTNKIH